MLESDFDPYFGTHPEDAVKKIENPHPSLLKAMQALRTMQQDIDEFGELDYRNIAPTLNQILHEIRENEMNPSWPTVTARLGVKIASQEEKQGVTLDALYTAHEVSRILTKTAAKDRNGVIPFAEA